VVVNTQKLPLSDMGDITVAAINSKGFWGLFCPAYWMIRSGVGR